MIKQYWASMIFMAILVQVLASCSSTPETITEEDRQAVKNRFPNIQSHRNLDRN